MSLAEKSVALCEVRIVLRSEPQILECLMSVEERQRLAQGVAFTGHGEGGVYEVQLSGVERLLSLRFADILYVI